jgi:hypothetical protein
MTKSHFERFLVEATIPDETQHPLGPDCFYGLYTSWCLLHNITPVQDFTFRSAMERCGIDWRTSRRRMIGPAAADYILESYPDAS